VKHDSGSTAVTRLTRSGGIALLPVLILLGLLAGGVYNYHRNWQVEASVPRPYGSYSQVDLEALLAAYQAENAMAERQYSAAREGGTRDRGAGFLDQNIAAFEAAQQQSANTRVLGARLSMQQVATGEIEAEIERRKNEEDPLKVHLRRLLTL
jgi:hypothetical protein